MMTQIVLSNTWLCKRLGWLAAVTHSNCHLMLIRSAIRQHCLFGTKPVLILGTGCLQGVRHRKERYRYCFTSISMSLKKTGQRRIKPRLSIWKGSFEELVHHTYSIG